MQRNARTAFNALQKKGVVVYDRNDYRAEFIMSGEDVDKNGYVVADFYQEYIREHWNDDKTKILNVGGIRTDINDILAKNGLMAEWIDGGTIGIYQR